MQNCVFTAAIVKLMHNYVAIYAPSTANGNTALVRPVISDFRVQRNSYFLFSIASSNTVIAQIIR